MIFKRHQNRSSCQSLKAFGFSTEDDRRQLILPKQIMQAILFSHQNHIGKRAKCLTLTHTVTLPVPEILAKHSQHSTTNDKWMRACQTCACLWSDVQKKAFHWTNDNLDAWFKSRGQGATYTDTKENAMGRYGSSSPPHLLCPLIAEIWDQNTHAHEMHMSTHQASTQHNTAMTSNRICFFTFCAWGS